jgi:hypothetical protein
MQYFPSIEGPESCIPSLSIRGRYCIERKPMPSPFLKYRRNVQDARSRSAVIIELQSSSWFKLQVSISFLSLNAESRFFAM